MPQAVNLDERFSQFAAPWSPKVIARINDNEV
jgi:hypothetical protein